MKKIPTAEKFVKGLDTTDGLVNPYSVVELLKEFAKLHVKAALEAAVKNADLIETDGDINPETILNAYPAINIK